MSIRSPLIWFLAAALLVSVAAAPGRAAEPNDDLEALQKRLLDRMLNGNPTAGELRGLIDEMNKKMLKRFPDLPPFEQPNPSPSAVSRWSSRNSDRAGSDRSWRCRSRSPCPTRRRTSS